MIETLLINALIIAGVKLASEEGMILSFLPKLNLPKWVAMPLYDCATCMASLWSVPAYLFYFGVEQPYIWPFYVLALSATSTLVYSIIDRLSK
jgi:hypothetical protein